MSPQLGDIRSLQKLKVTGKTSLRVYADLPILKELWLEYAGTPDAVEKYIGILGSSNSLEKLSISSWPEVPFSGRLEGFDVLMNAPNLKSLKLSTIILEDISFVERSRSLEVFEYAFGYSDLLIDSLSCGERLTEVLIGRGSSQFRINENCNNLVELVMGIGELENISSFSFLENIEILSLIGNDISDVTPLKDLIKLKELSLFLNEIVDPSPLYGLTDLVKLNIRSNNISPENIELLQQNLPMTEIIALV